MEAVATKEVTSVLQDLIKINNDRIEGYEKALKDLKPEDTDLNLLFMKAIDQSRAIRTRLGGELQAFGSDVPSGSSASGSIHRAWLEVKATFTGHGRHAILASCEFGEDAAQKAYESALSSGHLPEHLSALVLEEKQELLTVHDQIKALRDQSK